MTITLYGIPNCDTVKRARAWLAERSAEVLFHDYRKSGLEPERLAGWVRQLGWERLLNRQGTTWRRLDDATKAGVVDAASARRLMLEHVSVVRRPVVEWPDGALTAGFDPTDWAARTDAR